MKLQYCGAEHGLVLGIGVVNLVHSAGAEEDFYPIDYRIHAPQQDGRTKNNHFAEIVKNAIYAKKIRAKRILFDIWYASAEKLKLVQRLGQPSAAPGCEAGEGELGREEASGAHAPDTAEGGLRPPRPGARVGRKG